MSPALARCLVCSGLARIGLGAEPANHVRVGRSGDCRGAGGVKGEAHPLQQRDAGVAVAVDLDEGCGGALVAGGMEDYFWREPEIDGGGVGPGLGRDLVAHVGARIRPGGGALLGQHSGKMARFVEEITGVEQTFGVDDEAARRQRDAGQEGAGAEGREANGEADLPEPVEDKSCSGGKHRP